MLFRSQGFRQPAARGTAFGRHQALALFGERYLDHALVAIAALAADAAFDYLIDRYRTSSLAILEYHQHIPAPDPMANASTDARAEYYGVQSTPTAIFGGTTGITSGGSRMVTARRSRIASRRPGQLSGMRLVAAITARSNPLGKNAP